VLHLPRTRAFQRLPPVPQWPVDSLPAFGDMELPNGMVSVGVPESARKQVQIEKAPHVVCVGVTLVARVEPDWVVLVQRLAVQNRRAGSKLRLGGSDLP